MRDTVEGRYEALAQQGAIEPDPAQRGLVRELDALLNRFDDCQERKKGALGWLFSRHPDPIRGLYIWGSVGRGKTLLMDLFFEIAPEKQKRRVHFHAFMSEVHGRIFRYRQKMKANEGMAADPIPVIAGEIVAETNLLCFDEFSVTDIADAMILGRLFEQLFKSGVVIVATSNVVPDELYKGGLNRALFLPFIDLVREHMDVFHLTSPKDFRVEKGRSDPLYITAGTAEDAECRMRGFFKKLTGCTRGTPRELINKGHPIEVPEAVGGVALFRFEDLCARPLGASDYLEIARNYHTLLLSDVPVLDETRRNEAKRFINLVDTLYDTHTKLIISAAAEPNDLWEGSQGTENFEFARTASRLTEMRSEQYFNTGHAVDAPARAEAKSCA
ncbi:cell division protein ZapE [Faunimonas pinastri]|uniref:Cell division protein ZapE n=1 Tax=Faunimonas pinastri TaxID=1855383 RepID=A0A1H9JCA2_9HYPH|nr:cell division protein ZapE [Faunimonas pinastri]SEQ84490.1 cell division protein ZapE [Faunimonas pinastri]